MARSIPDLPTSGAGSFELPLIQEIESLPGLIPGFAEEIPKVIATNLTGNSTTGIKRIYITGSGDSFHAGLSAALAFNRFSGATCQAVTSMQMARYTAGYISADDPGDCLVIGVSSSGQVSRTIEALRLARKTGARTIALTREGDSPLAEVANHVVTLSIHPIQSIDHSNDALVVPGMRSYVASLIGLYLVALHLGLSSGHLDGDEYDRLQREIGEFFKQQTRTISNCKPGALELVESWRDARHFEICGSGPNFGTAQFSAAKLLEASGDTAMAQDLEEWAHLQYFGRHTDTPTLFISAGSWDEDRAREVVKAAKAIGRRVAVVAPANSSLAKDVNHDVLLPIDSSLQECFSPVVTCIPGAFLAAYRSEQIGETYFRSFSDGRSIEGGGGISRIRTSHQIEEVKK